MGNLKDASDIWDKVRRDVIHPLGKEDFEFIPNLQELIKRSVSEIEEILEVISRFSLYGRISLLLDAQNALHSLSRAKQGQQS